VALLSLTSLRLLAPFALSVSLGLTACSPQPFNQSVGQNGPASVLSEPDHADPTLFDPPETGRQTRCRREPQPGPDSEPCHRHSGNGTVLTSADGVTWAAPPLRHDKPLVFSGL